MVRAKKSLGQNFLIDPTHQARIVAALDPTTTDEVVEIGPGQGALTRHLLGRVGRLVLIELDNTLAAQWQAELAGDATVEVVHRDALEVDLAEVSRDPAALKVVGNIPYNITTPLIFWLLDRPVRPRLIVLMIQREVADRILAPPGDKQYGALSVGVRTVATVERLFHVPRGAFRPVPDVDSTVIRITPLTPPPLEPAEAADLRDLTRTAFGWRRKQLQKILRNAPGFELPAEAVSAIGEEIGVAMDARPEALSPDRFIALSRALRARGYPAPDADGAAHADGAGDAR